MPRRLRRRPALGLVTLMLELAGLAMLTWGAWSITPWVGRVTLGVLLLGLAFLLDPRLDRTGEAP